MNKSNRLLICIVLTSTVFTCSLVQVRADVVFQDNFESGNFSKWTVVGSPNMVTKPILDGNAYAAQFALNSTDTQPGGISYGISYLQATFPSSNTATLEFYLQTDTLSQSGSLDVAEIASPSNIPLSQDTPLIFLSILPLKNGSLVWAFTYPSGENTPIGSQTRVDNFYTKYTQSSVQTDAWYKFDIAISSSSNIIQLSINNSPVFTATNQFIWNPTVFKLGNIESYNYSNGNIYIDDITVSNTANISQLESTPSPTLIPTAAPTQASSPSPTPTSTIPEFPVLTTPTLLILMVAAGLLVNLKKHKR